MTKPKRIPAHYKLKKQEYGLAVKGRILHSKDNSFDPWSRPNPSACWKMKRPTLATLEREREREGVVCPLFYSSPAFSSFNGFIDLFKSVNFRHAVCLTLVLHFPSFLFSLLLLPLLTSSSSCIPEFAISKFKPPHPTQILCQYPLVSSRHAYSRYARQNSWVQASQILGHGNQWCTQE